MFRLRLEAAIVALLAGSWIPSGFAHAQDAAHRAEAISIAERGLAKFTQGAWDEALDLFSKANQLNPAPTLQLYMARCQRNRLRFLEARDLYQEILRTPLSKDASEAFADAKRDAKSDLLALEQRLPSVQVLRKGQPITAGVVAVDGRALSPSEASRDVALNPGKHQATLTTDGQTFQTSFALAEGQQRIQVELEPTPSAQRGGPVTDGGSEAQQSASDPRLGAKVALGVGAVGLVGGLVTGGIAWSKAQDLRSRCENNHCPVDDADREGPITTLTTASLVGFGIAVAGAITGTALWFTADVPSTTGSLRSVGIGIAPAGIRLTTSF